MTESKDNSSLPLLLSITGAVIVVAVGGWFLLNQQSAAPNTNTELLIDVPTASTDAGNEDVQPIDNQEEAAAIESVDTTTMPADGDELNVDTELRKARLAADAEILVLPTAQSALFYYSRVLSIDPEHAIAHAELDAILTNVAQRVSQHLAAEEYDEAYEIAILVARQEPEHALVIEAQTMLDALTEDLVQQSITFAQDGNYALADERLATALALPGRNPSYFDAIRDSIAEIRAVREAAELDRARRAQLAADDARAAWVEQTQAAIAAGNLIGPAGASAKDLLAEPNAWVIEHTQLTNELLTALLDTAENRINNQQIDNQQLDYVDNLLSSAADLGGDPEKIGAVRATLETTLMEEQSNRIVPANELVSTKTEAALYPPRAEERNVSGWVEVYFTVMPNGKTADIAIANSDPETTFDRAAMKAVEKWEFEPVEYRGQIISQRAITRLVFAME